MDAGTLVVAKRDRLARDVPTAVLIERLCGRKGDRAVAADGLANGDGHAAALMQTLLEVFATYEPALIRALTRAALAIERARGDRQGDAPGVVSGTDGRLMANRVERAVVARVRELRVGQSASGDRGGAGGRGATAAGDSIVRADAGREWRERPSTGGGRSRVECRVSDPRAKKGPQGHMSETLHQHAGSPLRASGGRRRVRLWVAKYLADHNSGLTRRRESLVRPRADCEAGDRALAAIGWHTLRHSFAMALLAKGVDRRTVQDLMRHKTAAMTMRYALSTSERRRAAVGKMLALTRTEQMVTLGGYPCES